MTSSEPTLHHNQMTTTTTTTGVADDNSTTTATTGATTPWSSETNWTVSCGSLDSAVTFESFDFPIDSEFTAKKPPLLLLPPSSSEFEPCEIKLNFTQKHEICQVYVRSTARVYEIYYAPNPQSENEYLCTVRCSAASLEDNMFPATDVKEATSVNLNGVFPKERVAGENNIGNNEDDWVEVKLPVGRVDDGNTYLPNQTSNNIRNHQDYYEATAEINDSEPCISLTLRLLSLQSKGCVYIDEVYVFADAIDTDDSENQTVNAESSAGSSLMTMLVPTLLGLSKSRSLDQHNSKSVAKPIETEPEPEPEPEPATSTNPVNLSDQQGGKLLKQSENQAESSQLQVPAPTSDKDKDKVCDLTTRNDFSYNRAESLLEQLVSRVTRIEDICMKFEEKMLKPINNIEARLQHVEQQVELLAKNSRFLVSPSFPKFETNHRSISNNGSDFQLSGEAESEKEGSISNETIKLAEDIQLHEGLMATDPESECCDEKAEPNDVLESPKKENPKKSVSIDDALAAALAGFSSFTKANESPEEECLNRNQAPIDTTSVSNSNGEASICCESLNATASESEEEEEDTTKSNESLNGTVPNDSFCLQETSKEATDPTHENHESDAQLVKQDSIRTITKVNFDKSDILKHFPDQSPDAEEVKDGSESRIDFESSILEVKFASLENGNLISRLESLLSYTDDPATDDGLLINPELNVCDLEAKTTNSNANDLLVELDGDHGGEELQQDLPVVQQEISFASLI